MDVAADEFAVYWINQNANGHASVEHLDLATGAVTTIATEQGLASPMGILLVNGSLCWLGNGVKLLPGATVPTFLGWHANPGLATDGQYIVTTEYGDYEGIVGGSVWARTFDPAQPEFVLVNGGQPRAWDIHIQDGYIYWANQGVWPSVPASINRLPVNGGAPTRLVEGFLVNPVFTVDSQYVYYIDAGTLYALPNAGGSRLLLAHLTGGMSAQANMILRNHNLYWTDGTYVMRAWW